MPLWDEHARALLADLCERFPMGYVPVLRWKGLRVSAGMAYYKSRSIALSTRVLRDEQSVRDTLMHEYAHLLAVHRHGMKGAGHGKAWQQAMRDLGLEPSVRHHYAVERNTPRQRVRYKCGRCGNAFLRSRRFPKRTRYYHVGCGGELRLESVARVTSDAQTP